MVEYANKKIESRKDTFCGNTDRRIADRSCMLQMHAPRFASFGFFSMGQNSAASFELCTHAFAAHAIDKRE